MDPTPTSTVLPVDLDATKPITDKRSYRLVLLANGLECLLVSYDSDGDDGEYESDSSDEDDRDPAPNQDSDQDSDASGDHDSDDHSDESAQQSPGKVARKSIHKTAAADRSSDARRKSAASMAVGVGSFQDPDSCQGLAHFLEHMLFMGSTKYPGENEFEALLSRCSGESNAFTEAESTVYHFSCAKESFHKALDVFAQFFISPLLLPEATGRELNAIESEFNLCQNSDSTRLQELWCFSSYRGHPYSKFGWGNHNSLRDTPARNQVDVMAELRKFYDAHYTAGNMRLVLASVESLDSLQRAAEECFQNVRPTPPIPGVSQQPQYGSPFVYRPDSLWEGRSPGPRDHVRVPYTDSEHGSRFALGSVFLMVPVKNMHELTVSWPIPPLSGEYKVKPDEYVAHLVGHESKGSLLSELKRRGWAVGLHAGVDMRSGYDNNTHCSMFLVKFKLSMAGIEFWKEIIQLLYEYLNLLRRTGPQRWVHQEISDSAKSSYMFMELLEPGEEVEEMAETILPKNKLAREDYLVAPYLIEDWNPDRITAMLESLTPENMRIDFVTSALDPYSEKKKKSASTGGDGEGEDEGDGEGEDEDDGDGEGEGADDDDDEDDSDDEDNDSDNVELDQVGIQTQGDNTAQLPEELQPPGLPSVEPHFGTEFWCLGLSPALIGSWKATLAGESKATSVSLPPRNPYLTTEFALKELPKYCSSHPLLGAALRVRVQIAKQWQWVPGTVTQFDGEKSRLLVSFEGDMTQTWYAIQSNIMDTLKGENMCFEMNDGTIRVQVTSMATSTTQGVFAGEAQVGDETSIWNQFPAVPPHAKSFEPSVSPATSKQVKIWHLQDRIFRLPKVELHVHILSELFKPPLDVSVGVLMDILMKAVKESLTEEVYLAEMAELHYQFRQTERGVQIWVGGFNEKLLLLFEKLLTGLVNFANDDIALEEIDVLSPVRIGNIIDTMKRSYSNASIKGSKYATHLRLCGIRPWDYRSKDKHECLVGLEADPTVSWPKLLRDHAKALLRKCRVHCFLHGNADERDCRQLRDIVDGKLNVVDSKPLKKLPKEHVLVVPSSSSYRATTEKHAHRLYLRELSVDPDDRNSTLELYYQLEDMDIRTRAMLDIVHCLMDEKLYDRLRTQQQVGYSVSCGVRYTSMVLGFVIKITSASHHLNDVYDKVMAFLAAFEETIRTMPEAEYAEHVCALAGEKLEKDNNLSEEAERHWDEILNGTFEWNSQYDEVASLRGITQEQVLAAFKSWFAPSAREVRMLEVNVVGRKSKTADPAHDPWSGEGRGRVELSRGGEVVVSPHPQYYQRR